MTIQRAIIFANLAFIALGAYFASGLFYQAVGLVLKPPEQAVAEKKTTVRARRVVQKAFSSYKPIQQRDLFKTGTQAAAPSNNKLPDFNDLKDTELNLKLWGTVTGNTDNAYAVIENTKSREQNLYRKGDEIQNATVKLILKDKVILSRNGKDEMLPVEEIKAGKSRRRVVAGGSRVPPRSGRGSGGVRKQRVSLRREMINNAIQDVSKLMTQVKITPKMGESGQQEGLSMSNIKPNSIFRRMGLRNGDVLKTVDGQQIQSVDDALKLYESLKSADSVAVQIQRRGSDRTIEYNIR